MAAHSSNTDREVHFTMDLVDRFFQRAGADWGVTLRYLTLIVVPVVVVVTAVSIMFIAAGSGTVFTALSGGAVLYRMYHRQRVKPRRLPRRGDSESLGRLRAAAQRLLFASVPIGADFGFVSPAGELGEARWPANRAVNGASSAVSSWRYAISLAPSGRSLTIVGLHCGIWKTGCRTGIR